MAKVRASFLIPEDVLDRIRDAVIALSGPPDQMTMAQFATDAFEAHLKHLAASRNQGQPFPRHKGRVRTGRPIGSRSDEE